MKYYNKSCLNCINIGNICGDFIVCDETGNNILIYEAEEMAENCDSYNYHKCWKEEENE